MDDDNPQKRANEKYIAKQYEESVIEIISSEHATNADNPDSLFYDSDWIERFLLFPDDDEWLKHLASQVFADVAVDDIPPTQQKRNET